MARGDSTGIRARKVPREARAGPRAAWVRHAQGERRTATSLVGVRRRKRENGDRRAFVPAGLPRQGSGKSVPEASQEGLHAGSGEVLGQ